MRKKLVGIGDDYWVRDEQGRRVFRVGGKVLRIRKTFVLEDAAGTEVATIRKPLVALRDTMNLERGGQVVGRVRKALFAPFRQRFDVELANGDRLVIQGHLTDHEYPCQRDGGPARANSQPWVHAPETDAALFAPCPD